MPKKDSKEFDSAAEELESMADGTHTHSGETDFPSKVKEQEMRDMKEKLENDRQDYDKTQALADQKSETFKATLKKAKTMLADNERALQSFYGLRSLTLKDFGLVPPKPGGRKGPRTPKKHA